MIEVTNLTKIYHSKKNETKYAINNVTFKTNDTGFIFIIGKSGSGKSTLLSLIGGLEDITEGNIKVNGNDLNNYSYQDYVNYRNTMIGYIFQDYHLLDELTVKENIQLSLNLQNISDDFAISKALKDVDLDGYENRFPKELSGGEKQRVAIARALIKNPAIILADEPTGNLDSKTTTQILSILKKLANERLILIVSHNPYDAKKYADRIIELSEGRLKSDYIRNPLYCDDIKIFNQELYLPINKELTTEETNIINEALENGKIKKLIQVDDVFIENSIDYSEIKNNNQLEKPKNLHITFKNVLSLAYKFIKLDVFKLFIYSFIVACLIVVLGLCELIVTFDSSKVMKNELNKINQTSISLYRSPITKTNIEISSNRLINITDEEIAKFENNNYQGNIYKMVNYVIDFGENVNLAHWHLLNTFTPSVVYYPGTRGTLITSENYLKQTFGNLEYTSVASEIKPYGVYITDYTADSIIYYHNKKYKDYNAFIGKNLDVDSNIYVYINGIIKTNYKEKYDYYLKLFASENLKNEEIVNITSTKDYQTYYNDIIENLAVSYTFNENFVNDLTNANLIARCPSGNSTVKINQNIYNISSGVLENAKIKYDLDLNENEIAIGYLTYNSLFKTEYTKDNFNDFTPHEITFNYSYFYDAEGVNIIKTFKATVVKLTEKGAIQLSDNLFKEMLKINTFTSNIYFDDLSNSQTILDIASEIGLSSNSLMASSLNTMTKAVTIFKNFFTLIFIVLFVSSLLIVINYGLKLINEKKYEIGILKALGIRDIDLVIILGSQLVLLLMLTIILYILGSVLFIDLANEVLVNSLTSLAPTYVLVNMKFLRINPFHFIINSLILLIIIAFSLIVPLLKLHKLKPSAIIKAKE